VKQRFYSLDVFRGATVAFMILVNDPGSWSHIYAPLEHAPWHGLTPTDLVFPFFLFAVGNAMAFVMPRYEIAGDGAFWKKVLKRTALIFLIGLFLNWFPFVQWQNGELIFRRWTWTRPDGELAGVRILGVLPRIALCYFFASVIIFYAKPRGAFLIGTLLLLIYWALCIAGNPSDPYSLDGWFGTDIDKKILGEAHMYHGEGVAFDPEGIMSTIPAIVEVIFGFLVGDYIRKRGKTIEATPADVPSSTNPWYQTLTILFIAATALLFTAYAWNFSFPINKKIWTSSYVVCTVGLAIVILATLIYFIELKNKRSAWTRFFDMFGKNPLFIFALSGLIPKTLALIRIPNGIRNNGQPAYISPWGWFYENICAKIPGPPEIGSLVFAISVVLLLWAIAYWMDRRKIYIRV
jgi:predicted acyltransferase